MPAATGARALLSAKTPSRACRLPRVAFHGSPAPAPRGLLPGRPTRQHAPCRPHDSAVATRCFHTSSPALARPDESNPETPAPADSNKDKNNGVAPENNQPAETPAQAESAAAAADSETRKEKLKSAGYGSARARANRNTRVEEATVLELPVWFEMRHVSLYEQRPLGVPATLLHQLSEEDREGLLEIMEAAVDKYSLTEAEVETWKDKLRQYAAGKASYDSGLEVNDVHHAAFWQTLLAVYHPEADPEHIEALRKHHATGAIERALWWSAPEKLMSGDAQRWFANLRSDAPPGSGLHISPLAKRPDPEYPDCMELLAALQSQLTTAPPAGVKQQGARRPPIVLSVLNGKGSSIADAVINDIATDLKADVVHINAHDIARILGSHLGQNQYLARGSLSMLGYAAAEMNGRLAVRPSPESEAVGMVAVELPSRLRSFLAPRDTSTAALSDGRWEDMKISAALEQLVAAVDRKRAQAALASSRGKSFTKVKAQEPSRDLIIHLHDYVELSSLYPAIVHKLRAIADRMWMAGRRVVFVGSSAGDMDKSPQLRDQLSDLGRDGAHVIPFHASDAKENKHLEEWDNYNENLANIEDMLRAKVGDHVPITIFQDFMEWEKYQIPETDHKVMLRLLSNEVYDAQWVYRLVSWMVGARSGPTERYGPVELNYAIRFMRDRNKHWKSIYPAVRPPYYSPLSVPRPSPSSSSDDPSITNLTGAAASKDYNADEKKLLSGLINAKDIHTTFADIIAPADTKESLVNLTTLSLVRPEAFSYGVLKTEHIPGCLLYGPPGTGKTLLAKAVAKESGASMLSVSAADINDKWVGSSERNVQALFSLARKLAPCVIFLDEADALLAARRTGGLGGRAAHRETITQFLREWDGLTAAAAARAFIMVATNRPFDLDDAVLRRLPRKILVDLPLAAEREAILRVMLREEHLAGDVDLAALARETELYSGSDLKNLCVAAAMEAVREEVRAKEAWQAEGEGKEGEYAWPARRVLEKRHFDKGLRDISASVSGDMESLQAIRKFDEQYGDAGRKKKVRRGMGFEVVPQGKKGSEEARVRQVDLAAA